MRFEPTPSFDIEAIKATVKLVDLLGHLDSGQGWKRAASSGDEWHGPCPSCGGEDRFAVKLADDVWFCRNCTGDSKWHDVIDLEMLLRKSDFQEAATRLHLGHVQVLTSAQLEARRREIAARDAEAAAHEAEHRAKAREHLRGLYAVREYRARLARHDEVIASLLAGGMSVAAVDAFGFGYGDWFGHEALTIPWQRDGNLMSVQYRLLDVEGSDKYRWHKGTSYHVWNADSIDQPHDSIVLISEGAKKGAAVWSHGVTSAIAVPNNSMALGALQRERDKIAAFDRAYLILDPDSTRMAMQAACELEMPSLRVVILPDKVDDWLVSTDGDVDLLMSYCEMGRTA